MMTPGLFVAIVFVAAIGAGLLGSLVGLGGGILIVPLLTIGFDLDIRYAIGASIVSVIATSSGAGAALVRDRLTNIRVATVLQVATSLGAVIGALLSPYLSARLLYLLFGVLLIVALVPLLRESAVEPQRSRHGSRAPQELRRGPVTTQPIVKVIQDDGMTTRIHVDHAVAGGTGHRWPQILQDAARIHLDFAVVHVRCHSRPY